MNNMFLIDLIIQNFHHLISFKFLFIGTAFAGPFTAAFQPSSYNVHALQPPIIPLVPPPFDGIKARKIYRLNLDFTDAAWQVPPPDEIPLPPPTGAIFLTAMSKIQQTL